MTKVTNPEWGNIVIGFVACLFIPLILIGIFQIVFERKPLLKTFSGNLGWRVRVGTIAGFPISLHFSIIFWMILGVYAGINDWHMAILLSLIWVSVLVHELAHAVSCRILGMGSGSITLWFLGGYFIPLSLNQSPYELQKNQHKNYSLMVMAGPLSNLVLAGIFFGVSQITPSDFLADISMINLILAVVNMFPIPRLDGGQVFYLFLSKYFNWRSMYRVVGVILVVLGIANCAGIFYYSGEYPNSLANSLGLMLGGGLYALIISGKSDEEINANYSDMIRNEEEYLANAPRMRFKSP